MTESMDRPHITDSRTAGHGVDHAPIMVWMVDDQGVITLCEGDALAAFGVEPGQWVGLSALELFAGCDRELDRLRRAQQGESGRSTSMFKGRWLETRYTSLRNSQGRVSGVHAISIDVSEQKSYQLQLSEVAAAVSTTAGSDFFQALILGLASALDADYVFVGKLADEGLRVVTHAACANGEVVDNFSYELAKTPCADVLYGGICSHPRDVTLSYPDDLLLEQMGVQGYSGAALKSSQGEPLGLLVVLYKRPMAETPITESLLRIFSMRASVELELQMSAGTIKSSVRMYRMLSECNQALVRSSNETQQLQRICDILVEHGGYPFVWIGRAESADALQVTPHVYAGEAGGYLTDIDAVQRGERFSGQCIRDNRDLVFRDLDQAPNVLSCLPSTIKNAIALPMVQAQNNIFSVLWIFSDQLDAFDQAEQALLDELAEDMVFGLAAHRIRQALDESEIKFRLLAEASMVGVYMIQGGRLVYANPYMATAFGYSIEQLLGGTRVVDLVAPEDREMVADILRRRASGEIESLGYEFTGLHANGERVRVEVFGSTAEFNGQPCVIGTIIDITERQALEQQLQLMMRAIESSNNGIAISDLNQKDNPFIYVNQAFEQITGYDSRDIVGRNGRFLLGNDTDQPELEKLKIALHDHQSVEVVLRNYKQDGSLFWNDLSMAPVLGDQTGASHYISIINDISESKQYEQQLEQLSHYDSLTGLANKSLLRDRLKQSIIHADRTGRYSALLLLDIDRFKMLNQSIGISATDDVLRSLANRISNVVRQGDTVARLGADDFAVVLHDLDAVADVVSVTHQLMDEVSQPLDVGPEGMSLTCSIGIAVYPQDGGDATVLRRNAEAAQYKAMEQRNCFRFYTPELNERAQDRLSLEVELRKAVERDEFVLYYQPKVDLGSGEITGAEALIRWIHPERGLVPPNDFIPLAEDTGLIVPIGAWAMEEACRTIQAINERCDLELQIAVNLSAKQFDDEQLLQVIEQALASAGLAPELLECELTESMLMDDPDRALMIVTDLSGLGVRVALDDFGTGYSSLSYLKRFPIDTLKIDRSFVKDIPDDRQDMAISRAIIALAETLDLYVVAEGVETQEQRSFLEYERCNSMQGFLFSRPLPDEEFEELVVKHRQRDRSELEI